ncbi:MAG: Stk1 family PASTA domain-containing Ser/Thr kinase [Alkalibacterium sp.]|uniref:non-specific serine/threonine protein kinase n=1 Tax=Alkalibacterium gilvum TaxID=1130080 RepID=A0A1H6QVW8_9LACT|nr:Stk1 family PASTA domain-containing Ser/Thr kinase [Alkalibacterium gilvum]MDN6728869.1 Stk1 family PASTA domain-containing Ser/Thr kinase [Alkalibacterium sp.]SEI47749.1 serine/threonine protein kinase [Alkalibacterium gilvum]
MRPGERINDRYKLIREIGSGGMAKVFLAEDLILERQVAVKLMAYNFHDDEASIRRFKREALSTTELLHPNIVDVVDVGEDDSPYIVMEYVEGYDLKEYIKSHHPIPYKKTVDFMLQILSAVEYAHRHNIIHRDLKPQNILMAHDETVKITDFGIAVALSENSITQTNSLLGSVHYISPEQARGSMATKQSDIYSLGILLYELLSGKVPFDGESPVSIALKHFQNDIPSLKEKDDSLPQALENVVLKATAKEPSKRYTSVHIMKEDLKTALSAERIEESKFIPQETRKDETRIITPVVPPEKEKQAAEPVKADYDIDSKALNRSQSVKTNKKKKVLSLIIIFLAITVISMLAFIFSQPKEVHVPGVAGMTVEEATEELKALKLDIGEIIEQNDEEIEEGNVIRTNPAADSTLKEANEVDLYISLGKKTVSVQNYEEKNYEEVRAELTEQGFTVERENKNHNFIPEGHVISQSIDAGDEVVPSESTILLTVSDGPEGHDLANFTGYSVEGVEKYADEHNLSVTITREPHESIPEGQVASQSPDAGSLVYNGSRISVVLSTGPEEPEIISFDRGITIEYVEPDNKNSKEDDEPQQDESSNEPNHIEIYVNDNENSYKNIYREFDIYENAVEIISFNVKEDETASYKVLRNGEKIIEKNDITPNN